MQLTTLEQITREINADGYAIAKMIRQQMDTRDERAAQIVNAYEAAVNGSPEAEATVLELYNAWRWEYASVVAPIAAQLGNPLPEGVDATGAPAPEPQSPFFAPRASGGAEVAEDAAEPAKAAPAAAEAPKTRTRRAWSQADIANVTKTLVLAKAADRDAALSKLATEVERDEADVRAKAVELGLIEAPPAAAKYELTDTDKRVLKSNLLTKVVPDNVSLDIKISMFKYCAGELREIVKSLTE